MFLVSLLVLLVTVIGHITLCVAIINRIHAVDWPRGLVDGITAFLGIAILFGPVAMVLLLAMSGSDSPGKWPQFLSAYSGACSAVLLMGVLLRVQQQFDPERRGAIRSEKIETLELREQMGTEPFGPGLSRLFGRLPGNQILRPQVVERELNLPTLKPELGGLTIAHLSDLHMSGRMGEEYFHEVVRRVNAWNPDFIAITGDIIETEECLPWAEEVLGSLIAQRAKYFILGNHDKKNLDPARVRQALTETGMIDLGGVCLTTEVRGQTLQWCGNEAPWFGRPIEVIDDSLPTIALVHSPDQFDWACRNNAMLVLAGHNHGGQICFPLLGPTVAPSIQGVRYAGGAFRRGQTVMHVGRGTAAHTQVRYGCPAEIVLLKLAASEFGVVG